MTLTDKSSDDLKFKLSLHFVRHNLLLKGAVSGACFYFYCQPGTMLYSLSDL